MKKVILVLIFTLCFPLICFGIEYEVSGSDKNGNHVYGEVDVDQWEGEGYIHAENELQEKKIHVDWTEKGELKGYDEFGNHYELKMK
jgi:hypothetical protein